MTRKKREIRRGMPENHGRQIRRYGICTDALRDNPARIRQNTRAMAVNNER